MSRLKPGYLSLIFLGALFAAAHGGCSAAIVCDVTHPGMRGTVTAVVPLANNPDQPGAGSVDRRTAVGLFGLKLALTLVR